MPAQKEFFKLISKHSSEGNLPIAKLVKFVLDNKQRLCLEYQYTLFSATNHEMKSVSFNFFGELITRIISPSPADPLFNVVTLENLIDFFKKLDKNFIKTFINNISTDEALKDLLPFLFTQINIYHNYVYDQNLPLIYKKNLENAKALIRFFITTYPAFFKLTKKDLLLAALLNLPEIAKLALEQGVDVDCQAHDGATPIYLAAQEGSFEVATILVENGAQVNKPKFEQGPYPLMILVESAKDDDRDFPGLVDLLLENGADPNVKFRTALHLPARSNAWLYVLDCGNLRLIQTFLKYTNKKGVKHPVNLLVYQDPRYHTLRCAAEGDTSGEIIKLLRDSVQPTKAEQSSLDDNSLYLAMLQGKKEVIKELLELFLPYMENYTFHPLEAILLDLLEEKITIDCFNKSLSTFIKHRRALSSKSAIKLCALMVKQTKINLSVELAIVLDFIQKHQFPTAGQQIALLFHLMDQYFSTSPANSLLRKISGELSCNPRLSRDKFDTLESKNALLELITLDYELTDLKPSSAQSLFMKNMIIFLSDKEPYEMIPSLCDTILDNLNDRVFISYHWMNIAYIMQKIQFLFSTFSCSNEVKIKIENFFLQLGERIVLTKNLPDDFIEITRENFKKTQAWFFESSNFAKLIPAVAYEFNIRRLLDKDNKKQLLVIELETYIDYLVIAINKRKLENFGLDRFVTEKIDDINKNIGENSKDRWFIKAMVLAQVKLLWLLMSFNHENTEIEGKIHQILLLPNVEEIIQHDEVQGYLATLINELRGAGKINKLSYHFLKSVGLKFELKHLRNWKKREEANERRQLKYQELSCYNLLIEVSNEKNDVAFKAEEENIHAPYTLAEVATETAKKLQFQRDNENKFWRNFNKPKGRFTPKPPWLETMAQHKQQELAAAEAEMRENQGKTNIFKLFDFELIQHGLNNQPQILQKLEAPDMEGEFWGIFALLPEDFTDVRIYNNLKSCFKKGISNTLAGIHNDNGVYRIYPPGDIRPHASVYYRSNEKGTPIVLLVFDRHSLNHKYYQRKGFHTKNVAEPLDRISPLTL